MPSVTLMATGSYTVPGFASFYIGAIAHGVIAPSSSATEDLAPFFTAGTLSRFRAYISANTTVSTTFTLQTRNAGGLGAQFVTIPPGATGIFEDLTNTDTVTPSGSPAVEMWGYQSSFSGTVTGLGITIAQLSVVYTRAGNETPFAFRQVSSLSINGAQPITGTGGHSSTESQIGLPIYDAGTCRNAAIYIATNARAAPTTITLRKNFVDTAVVITVGGGATGWFYDTSNTVSVAKDDYLSWVATSVVGTFSGSHIGFEFVASSAAMPYRMGLGSITGGDLSVPSATAFLHAGGSLNNSATAAAWQSSSGEPFAVIGLRAYVVSSSVGTTATTFTLQINGVDTAGVLTIPAVSPAVGWHSVSMSIPVLSADFIGIKYVALADPPVISSIVLEPLGNSGPVVNAGPNQAVNLCVGATLSGSADDPEGGAMTYLWTQDSGPASAVIASPTTLSTGVTFPIVGAYVFRLTATDALGLPGFDTVQVTVTNDTPAVNAGPDQDLEWPSLATMAGSATDDGGALTYLWTQLSGPGTATITTPASTTTTISAPVLGAYVFQLAASDCALTGTDTVTITWHEAPYPPPTPSSSRVMRRLRRAPHLSNEGNRITFDKFQLDLETGLGLPTGQGEDPQLMLRWSDDGGKTWSSEHWVSAGRQGAYKTRAIWRRLGQARDRVFEVSYTDPVPLRLLAAWIDVRMGRN